MEKILIPADGSAASEHAVRFALRFVQSAPETQLFVLNVQEPPPAEVMIEAGIAPEAWQAMHQEAGRAALESTCKVLDVAKVPYTATVAVGHPVTQISARARELGCTRVIMGTRGMGALGNLVLGSVAMRVVHEVTCPVTLVK